MEWEGWRCGRGRKGERERERVVDFFDVSWRVVSFEILHLEGVRLIRCHLIGLNAKIVWFDYMLILTMGF